MPDHPTTDRPAATPIPRPVIPNVVRTIFGSAALARTLCLSVAVLSVLWLYWLLATQRAVQIHWSLELMIGGAALFSSAFVALYQRLHWAQPMRRFQESLLRIRDGEAAIDDLDHVTGALRPLAAEVQELLRELRQNRAELARLEQETSQRVAHRTDALERVVGSLRQQATRDPLTGLHNRRLLDEYLPRAMDRARKQDEPICLLMIDVDDFKLLNDTLGHAAGDELLRSFGQLIRSNLRDGDHAFRCGGDEFVIVLANATRRQGENFAKRLTSLVDALAKTLRVPRPPRLSIGLSTPVDLGPAPTASALLAEADKHLYAVKGARKTARCAG